MAKKNINVIKFDSLIDIKISGAFYARIRDILVYLASTADKEIVLKATENLKNDSAPSNPFEYNLETVMILIHEIENMAKEQNALTEQEVDFPDEDEDDSNTKSPQASN
jgi:hypothetical protein